MLYHFETFVLDTDRRDLRHAGQPVSIEPKVFDLLVQVITHRERVVSKDDLIAAVWKGRIVSDSAVTTCINAARTAIELAIMRRLDRLHLERPFAGARMLQGLLLADGCKIGHGHVRTLMRQMGIEALYRRPRTTKPEPGHKISPYLLRGIEITRPNQVGGDGHHLHPDGARLRLSAVVLDWFSRGVLSWRVSTTKEAAFCVETLEDALAHHGQAGYLQHRSRSAVHRSGLHRHALQERHCHQHDGDTGEAQQLIKTLARKGIRFVGTVREEQTPLVAAAQEPVETSKAVLALPDRPSVAVLPFTNLSTDPEQEYFADGIVEDIITALSRMRWLFVIARNSSFTYKGRFLDLKQVGRELGVRYLLEGSVRKSARRVRITAQLVDVSTGASSGGATFRRHSG